MNSKYPNKYVFSSLKQKNINWRVFWACYFNTKGHLFNIYWLITSKSPRSSKPPRTPADKQSHFGLMHRKYNFTLVATPVCSQLTLQASSSTWLEKLSTHNNNMAPWLRSHARHRCFYHFTSQVRCQKIHWKVYRVYFFFAQLWGYTKQYMTAEFNQHP